MALVQAQWALDSSADTTLSITRGMLQAATSDNVQPLALMACERFGGTIAMCPDTCRKIEKMALPTPPPAVLSFMRGVVGYSANDCATQLGRSLAGVQFLGLATAMISTMDAYKAAKALSLMLVDSAADKTLLPTVPHLKALLTSLEARSHRCGFADEVAGWHIMLRNIPSLSDDHRSIFQGCGHYPSGETLNSIISVFRQFARIGETTAVKAIFNVDVFGAWLIAFSKWCLGTPPSVYLDDGTPVIEQPGSKVVVMLRTDAAARGDEHDVNKNVEIVIEHSIGSPQTIVVPPSTDRWTGMVTIECFGKLAMQNLGLDRGTELAALLECLPYVLGLSMYKIFYQEEHELVKFRGRQGCHPLRGFAPVESIMQRMLGSSESMKLRTLETGTTLESLPTYQANDEMMKRTCSCPPCHGAKFNHMDRGRHCNRRDFRQRLLQYASYILCLSLFHGAEHLKVVAHGARPSLIAQSIGQAIQNDKPVVQKPAELLNMALQLVGHTPTDAERHRDSSGCIQQWAMSSMRGQAVYLTIYDDFRIRPFGYLSLSWCPGVLQFDNVIYYYVYCQTPIFKPSTPSPELMSDMDSNMEPDRPRNNVKGITVDWVVQTSDEALHLGLSLKGKKVENGKFQSHLAFMQRFPYRWFVLEDCMHDKNAQRQSKEPLCRFTSPVCPEIDDEIVDMIAVDGDDGLRLFAALNANRLVTIRGEACLDCCLGFMSEYGGTLIL